MPAQEHSVAPLALKFQQKGQKMDNSIIEYIIKPKNEGKTLLKKALAVVGYTFLTIILALLILALSPPLLYIPFFLVAAAFVALTVFITWKFLCLEYELIIGGGEMTVIVIYGRIITKRLVSIPINSFIQIGAYDDAAYEALCRMSLQKNYICVSSMSAQEMFYAVFDDGKDRCVIYFEAPDSAIRALKQGNAAAFRAGNIKS